MRTNSDVEEICVLKFFAEMLGLGVDNNVAANGRKQARTSQPAANPPAPEPYNEELAKLIRDGQYQGEVKML